MSMVRWRTFELLLLDQSERGHWNYIIKRLNIWHGTRHLNIAIRVILDGLAGFDAVDNVGRVDDSWTFVILASESRIACASQYSKAVRSQKFNDIVCDSDWDFQDAL